MAEMFQVKTVADVVRQGLKEPTWWAAIASVGLHGLIWIVVPLLPSPAQETEANIQRPVNLVELTPEEQARVPEFELPNTGLPPLVPAPSNSSDPFSSPNFSLTPLPGQSSLPVPGAPFFEQTLPPPPPNTPFPNFPVFPNFPIFGGTPPAPPASPAPIARRPVTPPPPAPARPSPSPEVASPELNKPEAKPDASSPEASETGESATPTPVASASPDPLSTATPTPAATPAPRSATRAEILASLPEGERSLYLPNAAGTRPQEVAAAMGDWVGQVQRWIGSIPEGKREQDYLKSITLEQPTAGVACTLGLSGGATVGVFVRPDGEVETDPPPVLLQSAGYEILNQEALAIARNLEYDRPGHKRVYQVNIKFAPPENCPAVESAPPAS